MAHRVGEQDCCLLKKPLGFQKKRKQFGLAKLLI